MIVYIRSSAGGQGQRRSTHISEGASTSLLATQIAIPRLTHAPAAQRSATKASLGRTARSQAASRPLHTRSPVFAPPRTRALCTSRSSVAWYTRVCRLRTLSDASRGECTTPSLESHSENRYSAACSAAGSAAGTCESGSCIDLCQCAGAGSVWGRERSY